MSDAVAGDGVVVQLLGVPVETHVRSLMHIDDLLHELRIVRSGEETGQVHAPADLAAKMAEILDAYSEARDATRDQAQRAADEQRSSVDLQVELPRSAAGDARYLLGLLEQADTLCQELHLLTPPAPPEVATLRRWMADEICRQVDDGADPTPFSG